MRSAMIGVMLAAWVGAGSASAQVGIMGTPSPGMGSTSPLGVPGRSTLVARTGIPLGATDLGTPGISPAPSGLSLMGPTGSSGSCPGGGSISGSPGMAAVPLYDGGWIPISGSASGAGPCATVPAGSGPSLAAASSTFPGGGAVGRVGIPLGSTELGAGGLTTAPAVPMPSSPPTGMSFSPGSSVGLQCPTTGTSMSVDGC